MSSIVFLMMIAIPLSVIYVHLKNNWGSQGKKIVKLLEEKEEEIEGAKKALHKRGINFSFKADRDAINKLREERTEIREMF